LVILEKLASLVSHVFHEFVTNSYETSLIYGVDYFKLQEKKGKSVTIRKVFQKKILQNVDVPALIDIPSKFKSETFQ